MQKSDGTYVSAGEFIPIAEKFGLARLIDHRVVELAIGLLRSAPNLSLSMNVSGETAGDSDWLALLRGLVQGDQSLTRRLMVEITETAALTDIEECAGFVRALKETGCQVAIDDFGAGYSSFKNLRLLDVDMVKIDGSFVKDMAERSDDRFLVRTLVELARNFSMSTVAEWVGDEATADLSEQAGVDFLQGFYFGMPQLAAPPAKKAPAQPAADGAPPSAPIPAGAAESRPDSAPAL
jgi:EAL domain-containing protein (putative c-di-GMP-specific phosphodiesterase class I)